MQIQYIELIKNNIMSISVKYTSVPKEYTYSVKQQTQSSFSFDLNQYYKCSDVFDSSAGNAIPTTGVHTYDGVDVWVHNQEKQGYMTYYYKSKEECVKLENLINDKKSANSLKIHFKVYEFLRSHQQWYNMSTYKFKGELDLIGYDDYMKCIEKDVNNLIKQKVFLDSIGESKSLNYLLHGPPGTGKTTMIRTFASKFNYPIFIANPNGINPLSIKTVMNPQVDPSPVKILLLEDFDRFLGCSDIDKMMSSILNSLDGLDDEGNIIRFFSANNPKAIYDVPALINRISAKFEFKLPTAGMLQRKLKRLLSFHTEFDEKLAEQYVELVGKKNIAMRPFVNHTLRYLFDENFLENMIAKIDELN